MNIIAIDLGTSLSKIIECDEKGNIINKMMVKEANAIKVLESFISLNNIDTNSVKRIILTGVGASKIAEEKINQLEVVKDNEFLCIAEGGLELAKKQEAIIASMGTGTAFVRVQGDDIRHLGGTGVGGGTLINMCSRFIGTNSFQEIIDIASKGDLSKVDLTIGDITVEEIKTLPMDITAANFGKLKTEANNADIALGIINMIFETIGMMSVFATQNDTIKDVVAIGSLTKVPHSKKVFEILGKLCKINFIIPENAEFAVAFGAVKRNMKY